MTAGRVRRALCVAGLVIVLAVAVIGPLLGYGSPTSVADEPYGPSTPADPLGTDHYGFDVLARVLDGGWRILAVSLVVVGIAYLAGLTVGMLAAVRGGWFDIAALRVVDVLMGLPSLIALTVVVAAAGRGVTGVAVAATIVLIPDLIRIIRAATAEVLGHEYVEAAQARGERMTVVLRREVLPNLRHVLIADVAVRWIAAVFTVSTASFLGLGVQPPAPDWGLMVYENQDGLTLQPLAAIVPAALLLVLLLSASTLLEDLAGAVHPGLPPRAARRAARRRAAAGAAPPAASQGGPADVAVPAGTAGWVHGLRVVTADGTVVLDGVDVTVRPGEVVALVGESGSGKTTTAMAMLGHFRTGLQLQAGRCALGGTDLAGLRPARLRRLRGQHAAYVAQDPRTALADHIRLGDQISEALRARGIPRAQRAGLAAAALASVGLPGDRHFQRRWPHQVSGGQRQRVALAAALAHRPRLLVLDEPTSALDLVTAGRLLADIDRLRREHGLAVLLVSHDLGAVRRLADRVVLLAGGRVTASGLVDEALPPTEGEAELTSPPGSGPPASGEPPGAARGTGDGPPAAATARPGAPPSAGGGPLLLVRGLDVARPAPTGRVLSAIDLAVGRGGSLSVLGESGCGKTSLVRCLAGLLPQEAGSVLLNGQALPPPVAGRSAGQRRAIAYVPQNPYDSLNPRHTVAEIVGRPLRQFGLARRDEVPGRCAGLLELTGLGADLLDRRPGALSGGQRQRVALARALAGSPDLLLCDEVTSALDPATGAAIVALLGRMRDQLGLGLVMVTHDPSVAARLGGEVLVLHDGQAVEAGSAAEVLTRPAQPYTVALLAASSG